MTLHFDNKRIFMCEICGDKFHQKITLEDHRVCKHSDERKYSCEECEMTFKLPNSLARHRKIHSNERNFKCCHCSADFKHQYNLRRHLKSVHGSDDVLPAANRVQKMDATIRIPSLETLPDINMDTQIAQKSHIEDVFESFYSNNDETEPNDEADFTSATNSIGNTDQLMSNQEQRQKVKKLNPTFDHDLIPPSAYAFSNFNQI